MIQRVHETLLDLGPGESWIDPDKEAVKRVTVALLAAGCAAESVEHLTAQMVKLTGRRIQDAIAVAETTDKDLNALISEALERLDWLVGVLRYGHPEGKAEWRPLEDEEPFAGLRHSDHSERILPPGSQRVVTSFARALKSNNIDRDMAVQLLQRIREPSFERPQGHSSKGRWTR